MQDNARITRAECNKNEENELFSLSVTLKADNVSTDQFTLQINGGEVIAEKFVVFTEREIKIVFEDLSFVAVKNYSAQLYGPNKLGLVTKKLITVAPEINAVEYVLDMEIIHAISPSTSNSVGITRIPGKNIRDSAEFKLHYTRGSSEEYELILPGDKPSTSVLKTNSCYYFSMLAIQGSRFIYEYISGQIRETQAENTSIGPFSESLPYSYIFPQLKAPEGKKLFSIDNNNLLTLEWYVQNQENSGINNVCEFFDCNLYVNNDDKYNWNDTAGYNSGKLTYKLDQEQSVIRVSACFGYYSQHFGEMTEVILILIKPEITLVECDKEESGTLSVKVKWATDFDTMDSIRVKISDGESVIAQSDYDVAAKEAVLQDLTLDPERSYAVTAMYLKTDESGKKWEGESSSPVDIIHNSPSNISVNYIEAPEKDYQLIAKWDDFPFITAPNYELFYHTLNVEGKTYSTTDTSIEIDNNSGEITALQIRVVDGISTGPRSSLLKVPYIADNSYIFDNAGRLLKTAAFENSAEPEAVIYEYDDRGNITKKYSGT